MQTPDGRAVIRETRKAGKATGVISKDQVGRSRGLALRRGHRIAQSMQRVIRAPCARDLGGVTTVTRMHAHVRSQALPCLHSIQVTLTYSLGTQEENTYVLPISKVLAFFL
jgi:hypothetical protein